MRLDLHSYFAGMLSTQSGAAFFVAYERQSFDVLALALVFFTSAVVLIAFRLEAS